MSTPLAGSAHRSRGLRRTCIDEKRGGGIPASSFVVAASRRSAYGISENVTLLIAPRTAVPPTALTVAVTIPLAVGP